VELVDKYSYWEDVAEYDLETAEAMLNSGRYLYVVFMCQQAVEKITKGLFVLYNGEEPPRTYNILSIFEKIQFKGIQPTTPKLDKYKEFLRNCLLFIFPKDTLLIKKRYPLSLTKNTPKKY
jgi:HEPN domain-containing protein